MVKILQQNPDDLNDWEDKGAEGQTSCVIPKTRYRWLSRTEENQSVLGERCTQTSSTHTWEISRGKKTLGRQACRPAWQRPNSMRQRPRPGSSVPEPWQSWHTRRKGRRCRTASRSGICGKPSLHHRRQKGTRTEDTPFSLDWSCSSEEVTF